MKYPLASISWDQKEYKAAELVFKEDFFTMGKYTQEFEKRYADWAKVNFAVFCNSGSSANFLALAACLYDPRKDLKQGDEVIVPAVSWSTTYSPIIQLGLVPKLVDVKLEDFNLDFKKIESSITSKTKAIFAVNLLGSSCNYDEIKKIISKYNLILLEDNCESMGASFGSKKTGTFGSISTQSTFFSHHISTMEGGICCTDDELLYEIMKSLRAHGWVRNVENKNLFYKYFDRPENDLEEKFHFVLPGFTFRPTEVSAAIGIEQIKKIDNFLVNRRKNAAYFKERLENTKHPISLQKETGLSSWFGFGIIANTEKDKKNIINKLIKNKIEVRPIVSGNMSRQPMFSYLKYEPSEFTNSEIIHNNGFMIGNHHFDIKEMIDLFFSVLAE